MSKKVTITKLFTKQEQGKKGPYTRMAIQTKEYGSKWISGFQNNLNENWKENDVVEIEITPSDKMDKAGEPYLNYRCLSRLDLLERRVIKLEQLLVTDKPAGVAKQPEATHEEDLPF